MRRDLFNNGWSFVKTALGVDLETACKESFAKINLPHDYLIYQTEDLYESSIGWYRKSISLEKQEGITYQIYFEGVYMDSTLFVNGKKVGCWKYGYSSFFFDLTDYLQDGENELVMRVVYQSPNSRWYSGAGIYRNVYWMEKESTSFVTDSLYVSCKPVNEDLAGDWKVTVSCEVAGNISDIAAKSLCLKISELGVNVCKKVSDCTLETKAGEIAYNKEGQISLLEVKNIVKAPMLWSIESPKLYELKLSLMDGAADAACLSVGAVACDGCEYGSPLDTISCRMGFRQFTYTNDKGLFLNGKHIKFNGVCEHHDLGAGGAAWNKSAWVRKLEVLREMGVNAIRTAHNMPAIELLDLCDEMGFLVMDEAFDMWEGCKTEFDYGNYFKEWSARDVRTWIRRDRNHPCIFLWSIGNEIYDTHASKHGEEITAYLRDNVFMHDYRENAKITMGSNYMQWEGGQNCADVLKYIGYNYAERLYDEHHKKHPDWFIFGSETASTLQSRGIYHFPYKQPFLCSDDDQCSSLGNCTTTWGAKNVEYCIIQERDHDFSMGQFLWTGFDYIGEPTPYQTRSCYFGAVDTAGFPKDTYYIYKAAWTDVSTNPFVHLFPYWDFSEGQTVDLRAATNAPCVELFVNGKSIGKQYIDHAKDSKFTGDWEVTYEPGEIVAVAYDQDGKELARDSRKSFGSPAKIVLTQYLGGECLEKGLTGERVNEGRLCRNDWKKPVAGAGDLIFVEVSVEDEKGNPVENANNLLQVSVSGAGYLAGLDNGDSTDLDEYKGRQKRLFSGKMVIFVAVGEEPGDIEICVSGEGLQKETLVIPVTEKVFVEGISLREETLSGVRMDNDAKDGAWIRKIELHARKPLCFSETCDTIEVEAVTFPENADDYEIKWQVVTPGGIKSPLAKVEKVEGNVATIKAMGDGEFVIRATTNNGQRVVKAQALLSASATGLGQATLNPYELVLGGIYTRHTGELSNGLDHGIASGYDYSEIAFDMVDFGDFGSDEITIPIFEGGSEPIDFEIWEGMPGDEGSEQLASAHYHKKSIWNTYQAETYKLKKRVKGVTTICLVFHIKVNIHGFVFKKLDKAYEELDCSEKVNVNGDAFTDLGKVIKDIGNNVTVSYGTIDFGQEGAKKISVKGYTNKPVNTIHLVLASPEGSDREIIEFPHRDGVENIFFDIPTITGKKEVSLVFLPGSHFDLESIQFYK